MKQRLESYKTIGEAIIGKKLTVPREVRQKLASIAPELSEEERRKIFMWGSITRAGYSFDNPQVIAEFKKAMSGIGGYKEWLKGSVPSFTPSSEEYGLPRIAGSPEYLAQFEGTKTTMTTKEQQLSDIEAKITSIAERFGGIKKQIATEGITTAGGQVLLAPTIPEYKTTEPDLTEAKSLTEYYRKQIEIQQKQATEAKGAYEEYLKTSQEQQKTWWEKIMAKPTITETAEEYYEKLGIKPEEYFAEREADIAAVDVLMQEYDTAVAAKQMALVREEERLAPMEFISARMNRVEKEANIRLSQMAAGVNTKLAIMEMKSGNFEQARSLVQEAVTNYTNDLKWEYQMFVDFREQNQDIISELDKKYQTALDKAEEYALLSWQKKEEDTTNIANLMLQYPAAGISFGDTIQEATEKASRWAAVTPEEELLTPSEATTLGVPYGTTREQAATMGITPLRWKPTEAGKPTTTEKKIIRLNEIGRTLEANRGTDGYTDPNVYLSQRAISDISSDEFDKKFSYLLSPIERERLRITDTGATKWEMESVVWQWLATDEAKALSDEEKSNQIKSYGLNPEDFGIYE